MQTTSKKVLDLSTKIWFIATAIGQIIFVIYIAKAYGGRAISGNIAEWGDMAIKGHVEGDGMGNTMFAFHLIMAIILTLGGLLQLLPWIRKNAINFHRYSGRVFIVSAIIMSLGGLYLVWVRGAILNMNGAIAITLNAILIILFALLTIKTARSKKMIAHRRWALRAFMVVNGVWFFRVGFMAWILFHQEAKWSTENLDGPFDLVWSYANYMLPLAILELYFFTEKLGKRNGNYLMSAVLFISTLIIIAGTFGAYLMMWGPSM